MRYTTADIVRTRKQLMTTEVRTETQHKQHIPQEALDMAQCLVEAFHPERIYLFGSFARGDTTPDSDYDFMMIVSASELPSYRRSQEAHRLLFGFHHAKDV